MVPGGDTPGGFVIGGNTPGGLKIGGVVTGGGGEVPGGGLYEGGDTLGRPPWGGGWGRGALGGWGRGVEGGLGQW